MGFIDFKRFVEFSDQSIDATLHHSNLPYEGDALGQISFRASRGLRQRIVKECLHDHVLRDSTLLQTFTGRKKRTVYKVPILARKHLSKRSVVIRSGHETSIADHGNRTQISTLGGGFHHGR